MSEQTTLTTREVADKLGTDPRTLRRYLRSKSKGVGIGNRYALTPAELPALKRSFAGWLKSVAEPQHASTQRRGGGDGA